jgi:hypothetical protein
MLITRKSILSGIIRTLDIPITGEQYFAGFAGECIQDVAPTLSNSDREFILSGAEAVKSVTPWCRVVS